MVELLTDCDRPRKYLSNLKTKLENEGIELSAKIGQLKMEAEDGKMRMTAVADTEQLFFAFFNLFHRQRQNPLNFGWQK